MNHDIVVKLEPRCEACLKIFTHIKEQRGKKKRFCDRGLCVSKRAAIKAKRYKEARDETRTASL